MYSFWRIKRSLFFVLRWVDRVGSLRSLTAWRSKCEYTEEHLFEQFAFKRLQSFEFLTLKPLSEVMVDLTMKVTYRGLKRRYFSRKITAGVIRSLGPTPPQWLECGA